MIWSGALFLLIPFWTGHKHRPKGMLHITHLQIPGFCKSIKSHRSSLQTQIYFISSSSQFRLLSFWPWNQYLGYCLERKSANTFDCTLSGFISLSLYLPIIPQTFASIFYNTSELCLVCQHNSNLFMLSPLFYLAFSLPCSLVY